MRDDDLVSKRAHAETFDVDAKLAGPEGGQREVRTTVRFETHHVVRRDLAAEDGIVPVLQHKKLVFLQHVGRACDVPRDEDTVGHYAVDIEDAAARVACNAPTAGGQSGAQFALTNSFLLMRRE